MSCTEWYSWNTEGEGGRWQRGVWVMWGPAYSLWLLAYGLDNRYL